MSPPDADTSTTAPARVLVVEDEPLIRIMIADALRDSGVLVVEAANAVEALGYLASGLEVKLVFTDVRMPGKINGLDLARHLKSNYPAVKVVITSGYTEEEQPGRIARFVPKPYSPDAVASLIKVILESQAE